MGTYTFEIAGLDNTVLADISGIASQKMLSPRLGKPSGGMFRVPLTGTSASGAISGILETDAGDGYPTIYPGIRRLIAKLDGTPVFNGYVWTIERVGGKNDSWATVTCWCPMIRWQTRHVQDADGSIVDGTEDDLGSGDFGKPILDLPSGAVDDPGLEVSGGGLLQEVIDNTIANDGDLGLTTSGGTFDTSVPPALDCGFALVGLPLRISELAAGLFAAGAVDVVFDYTAAIAEPMAVMSAVNQCGSDLTATVNFDWGTGDKNVQQVRHVMSMDTFANRIRYFLGTRNQPNRWTGGSLDATTTEVDIDNSASLALFGDYVDFAEHEARGIRRGMADPVRGFFVNLLHEELTWRMAPRELLYVTPQAGLAPEPFADYGLGDIVAANVGAALGMTITDAAMRVFGMNVAIGADGVGRAAELITTAEAA